jgi:CBS domain-containing protein
MKVTEIMTSEVEVVLPDASLIDAAKKMRSLDVGILPVAQGKQVLGVITDRDIAVRAVAEGRDPKNTRVQDCMSSETLYCFEDQESEEAVRLMEEKQIRRVLVLTRDNQLAGVVSLADVATRIGKARAGGATEAVSSAGASVSKKEIPIARNANPQGVSTARPIADIAANVKEAEGRSATEAVPSSVPGASKKEVPIARNANPKGVD